ncbi:LAMA2 [Cordylochernes scorpioides]|uniref:LAMA2 n=1 Tax=Cordylochernes scorpioides TaxID=51811 RepID=A0ABY6L7Y2_9ARAC|nr:LAMA2 [Cordylochernes scorpioides]
MTCPRCQDGYYGNPTIPGGQCRPCDCDAYGSRGRICDKFTGQCPCIDGTSGRDCSRCLHRHILTEYGCKRRDRSEKQRVEFR